MVRSDDDRKGTGSGRSLRLIAGVAAVAAVATLAIARLDLLQLLVGLVNLPDLIEGGRATVEGDPGALVTLRSLLDSPDPNFAIVTP